MIVRGHVVCARYNGRRRKVWVRERRRCAGQTGLKRCCDRARDLVLHREYVREIAIPTLGPQVVAARDIDELCRYAQPLADLADAAVEHRCDAELLADTPHVLVLATEGERRRTRCNAK